MMSAFLLRFANIMEQSGGQQSRASVNSVSRPEQPCRTQVFKKLHCKRSDALRMLEVRIKNLGPQLHAIGGDGMNLSALWQRSTPSVPERTGPDHFFAIEIDPSGPLRDDSGMPATSS